MSINSQARITKHLRKTSSAKGKDQAEKTKQYKKPEQLSVEEAEIVGK